MKRQFLVIPLLLITFVFLFSTKSFAAGQACCDSSTLFGYDTSSGQCRNSYPGVPSIPTNCDQNTEYCSGNTCVLGTLTECTSHQSCYDGSYRNTHSGCSWDGRSWFCTPLVSQGTSNSVFCDGDINKGINTALGCIKVGSGNDLITSILRLATGLGGGIALALILYGVFTVTTSAGMPDKLKAGSEIITSAVIGLIFILLSIFLVNLIGINILGIPGLS